MQIVFWIMFIVMSVIAIFYWYEFENEKEKNFDLYVKLSKADRKNEELENARENTELRVKAELYYKIFQSQNYNSLEDLKNKIKTILENTTSTNIVK